MRSLNTEPVFPFPSLLFIFIRIHFSVGLPHFLPLKYTGVCYTRTYIPVLTDVTGVVCSFGGPPFVVATAAAVTLYCYYLVPGVFV